MSQYGLMPSESDGYETEFAAEMQDPGEFELQGAEAEFGSASEEWEGLQEGGEPAESTLPSMESPLGETDEVQLAAELMEVTTEAELEQFLGKLFKNVSRGVGGFLRSPVGRSLGGIFKNVAKAALPIAGRVLGSFVAPGVGTLIGGKLGSMAGNLFEVDTEGADREEQEFEIARRFVRLAATAAGNAALDPRRAAPQMLARDAALSAARRYAPGLARRFRAFASPAPWYWPAPVPTCSCAHGQAGYSPQSAGQEMPVSEETGPDGMVADGQATARARSGRWIRQGRKIVILGA
ncbi:hypothetical protein ABZ840_07515 [Streptomyces sp. NPDC047117]|uniref:hypothetical protein n=1 Tax=Streptomyces sp. NPDC047117 TaxID=3155379 RepID=UPI0033E08B96